MEARCYAGVILATVEPPLHGNAQGPSRMAVQRVSSIGAVWSMHAGWYGVSRGGRMAGERYVAAFSAIAVEMST